MTLELVPWRGRNVPVLSREISRYSTQDYINWITSGQMYMGAPPVLTTYGNRTAEPISTSFDGYVRGMLYADGPVAAAEAYRLRVFGQAPLLYQKMTDGRAGDLFDAPELDRIRAPWAGATLSDLMKRALTYGDFAGNAFVIDLEDELVLVRPDWVEIILAKREYRGGQLGWKQVGIMYYEGGLRVGDGVAFLPGEYAHFVPNLPDPLATYRGMSWLTPLVREVQADKSASDHKVAFFENAASPNLAVSLPKEITPQQFGEFVDKMDTQHKGALNAYKTLYTAGGADVTVIGANMQQMDFSSVQGKGETRIANASGVPPVLLSFSEGMQGSSLNAGNYTAAKRNFVDTTMRDLWQNWAGSIQQMDAFRPEPATRLWYDGRDIPFLHEDAKDLADIQQTRGATINGYVTNGWEPESAVAAVAQDDVTLLKHTGLTSVQLLPPGAQDTDGDGRADEGNEADVATDPLGAELAALRSYPLGVKEDEGEDLDVQASTPEEDDALRALIDAVDDDDIFRARLLDVAEISRRFNRGQLRVSAGQATGGQWTKIATSVMADLAAWLASGAKPGTDPLAGYNQRQLKSAATQLGLNPPRGMRLVPLKALLIAHARTQRGAPTSPPGLPPGHKKVPANVAGTTGVTQVAVTPPATFGVPSWMVPTQTLEIHLNGTKIGKLERYSYGWSSTSAAGNPVLTGRTKTAAMQGLVQHHQQMQAAKALKTSVPGATLGRAPQVFGNSPDHYRVDVGGVDVGGVHGDDSDPNQTWTAFPPTGAAWGLQANPGSGQTYATRDEAIQGLVDAHNAHLASLAPPPTPPVAPAYTFSVRKSQGGQLGDYMMSAKGPNGTEDIGTLAKDSFGRWNAFPRPHLGIPTGSKNDLPGGPFRTRKDAADALGAAYTTATAPAPTPSATPAQVDPAVKAAQDVLYGVDPKAKNAGHQLQVYGGLRKSQYDALDTREQSTLLGDLSFIATTSKGPNAAKAQKLIDRFTPAGSPSGTVPKQAVMPPANVASAQTRVTDPAGTPGLLKMLPAGQRGSSGDGWTRTTSGGSGPWGQYGAAGLMLRHVDAQGVERFLMIERGAGISDPYKWQFPGGAKDELEDFYQGAAREVIEELGFKSTDLDQARVHGTHTHEAPNVMVKGMHGGQVPWGYVSIAATVPTQPTPDLSTSHARLETNDAKWMTKAEIEALDRQGKLLRPLAGGQLQANVMSLFPTTGPARPAPRTTRPARLTGTPSTAVAPAAHKTHRGTNLVATKAEQDQVRSHVSANRKRYRKKTGDERLSVLAEMQGFDQTPTVLSKAEIDRLLKTGDYVEAWRGVSGGWTSGQKTAAQINEDMRSGIAWFGTGVFGNGYYLATDKSVARQYADGTKNSIARVLIPRSAITRKPEQIKVLADATSSSNRTIYNGHRQGNGLGTLRDPGRYMAAAGIDGMEIPYDTRVGWASARHIASAGHPAYNWVNRTVLIVQEADP